jgi:hypothetical protein
VYSGLMRGSVVVLALLMGCSSRPVCPIGDLDCIALSFSITDFKTYDDPDTRDPLTTLATALPSIGASAKLTLSVQGALNFGSASDGALILLSWTDANGCRPSFCMSHCPRGVRCVSGARCTPSRRDGLTSSTTTHWVEYGSDPAVDEEFDLGITPMSASGCPADVASMFDLGDVTVAVGPWVIIPVHLPAPGGDDGGGDPVCGDGLHASTLNCTPIGSGGVGDTCISAAEYTSIFGTPLPSSCAPTGTTGCMDTQKGALVKPCCPGHTCNVGSACGGGSTVGGVCN